MVTFALGVYRDQPLAMTRIREIRSIYPEAEIVSIADGVSSPIYEGFCAEQGVRYKLGARLKTPDFGGRWTERWMRACLETGNNLFVKIDPDTGVQRRVKFPTASIFGVHGQRLILGGAIGMTRKVVETILDSGLLNDPKYTGWEYTYSRFGKNRIRVGEQPEPDISSQDSIFADVLKRLNLSSEEWVDAYIKDTRYPLDIDVSKYAFVHPMR